MRCSPFVLFKFRAPQIHIVRILQYELASLLCKHCHYRGPPSPRGKAYEYSGQLTDKSKFEVQNLAVGRDIVKTRPKERRRLAADTVGSGAILSNLAQIPTLRIALRVRLHPVRVILSEGRSPNRT